MILSLKKSDLSGELGVTVDAMSQARVSACVQCKKCSAGCPLAELADIKPHELVRLAQLGQTGELLSSRMVWQCTSCHTCTTRCPQQVDISAMNDALRRLSRERGQGNANSSQPTFNDSFLESIRKRGRVYELGLMTSYKLRTLRLFEDLDKLPLMLKKRKLRLLPTSMPGALERRRMWKRASMLKGGRQ
ncbi:MAG TPA: 4Fe-4S dicluster domain-containing protein [Polyangiaceae bacterium]